MNRLDVKIMAAATSFLWLLLTAKFARALVQKAPSFAGHHQTIPIGNGDAILKITEGSTETIDSGARIWESGLALSQWIQEHWDCKHKQCLELGAGTGIVGLTAAMLGAKGVWVTDKPEMMPLLEHNIRQNHLENARAVPLLWGKSGEDEDPLAMPPLDLVCGSDILYSPENFPLLIETLVQVCTPSQTQVLLAYPRRFTEDIFVELALEAQFEILPEEEIEANIFLLRMRMPKQG